MYQSLAKLLEPSQMKLIRFTKRVRTQLTKMHQSLPKLLEPN